jgi:ABC-2 type transport system permease protein
MKRFIGFVKKEFYHIFVINVLCLSFGMPIAQIMLFGFAIKRNQQRKIAVLDQSKDTET